MIWYCRIKGYSLFPSFVMWNSQSCQIFYQLYNYHHFIKEVICRDTFPECKQKSRNLLLCPIWFGSRLGARIENMSAGPKGRTAGGARPNLNNGTQSQLASHLKITAYLLLNAYLRIHEAYRKHTWQIEAT
jgi:hypothetical protein